MKYVKGVEKLISLKWAITNGFVCCMDNAAPIIAQEISDHVLRHPSEDAGCR